MVEVINTGQEMGHEHHTQTWRSMRISRDFPGGDICGTRAAAGAATACLWSDESASLSAGVRSRAARYDIGDVHVDTPYKTIQIGDPKIVDVLAITDRVLICRHRLMA